MEEKLEENNCFICFDSENLVKMDCACVGMFVHENCILKWLENKDNTCSVCKTSYNNIVLKPNSKKLSRFVLIIVIYLFSLFGLGTFMFVQGFNSDPQNNTLIMWGCLCLLISGASIITSFTSIFYEIKAPEKKYMLKDVTMKT